MDSIRRKGGPTPRPLSERFWEKVDVRGDDECWPWIAYRSSEGYGVMCDEYGKAARVHRIAYRLCVGSIPEGLLIRHTCDNPPCVNPRHLLTGTDKDNARDCVERGRRPSPVTEEWRRRQYANTPRGDNHPAHLHPELFPHGEVHHWAKLSDADIRDIVAAVADGESQRVIAKRYGIRWQYVWSIVHGKTRRDITAC